MTVFSLKTLNAFFPSIIMLDVAYTERNMFHYADCCYAVCHGTVFSSSCATITEAVYLSLPGVSIILQNLQTWSCTCWQQLCCFAERH